MQLLDYSFNATSRNGHRTDVPEDLLANHSIGLANCRNTLAEGSSDSDTDDDGGDHDANNSQPGLFFHPAVMVALFDKRWARVFDALRIIPEGSLMESFILQYGRDHPPMLIGDKLMLAFNRLSTTRQASFLQAFTAKVTEVNFANLTTEDFVRVVHYYLEKATNLETLFLEKIDLSAYEFVPPTSYAALDEMEAAAAAAAEGESEAGTSKTTDAGDLSSSVDVLHIGGDDGGGANAEDAGGATAAAMVTTTTGATVKGAAKPDGGSAPAGNTRKRIPIRMPYKLKLVFMRDCVLPTDFAAPWFRYLAPTLVAMDLGDHEQAVQKHLNVLRNLVSFSFLQTVLLTPQCPVPRPLWPKLLSFELIRASYPSVHLSKLQSPELLRNLHVRFVSNESLERSSDFYRSVARFPNLRYLYVAHYTTVGLDALAGALTEIEYLSFMNCSVPSPSRLLEVVKRMPKLRFLICAHCRDIPNVPRMMRALDRVDRSGGLVMYMSNGPADLSEPRFDELKNPGNTYLEVTMNRLLSGEERQRRLREQKQQQRQQQQQQQQPQAQQPQMFQGGLSSFYTLTPSNCNSSDNESESETND